MSTQTREAPPEEVRERARQLQDQWLGQAAKSRDPNLFRAARRIGEKAHDALLTQLGRDVRSVLKRPHTNDGKAAKGRYGPGTIYRADHEPVWLALKPFLSATHSDREPLLTSIRQRISNETEYLEAARNARTKDGGNRLAKQANDHARTAEGQIAQWIAEDLATVPALQPERNPRRGFDRRGLERLVEQTEERIQSAASWQRRCEKKQEPELFPPTWSPPDPPDLPDLPEEPNQHDGDDNEDEDYYDHCLEESEYDEPTYDCGITPPITFTQETLQDLWTKITKETELPPQFRLLITGDTSTARAEEIRFGARADEDRRHELSEASRICRQAETAHREITGYLAQNTAPASPRHLYSRETLQQVWSIAGNDDYQKDHLILLEDSPAGRSAREKALTQAMQEWKERTLHTEREIYGFTEPQRIEHRCQPNYQGPPLEMTTDQMQAAWQAENQGTMPRHWIAYSDSPLPDSLREALKTEQAAHRQYCILLAHLGEAEAKELRNEEQRRRRNRARVSRWELHEATLAAELSAERNSIQLTPPATVDEITPDEEPAEGPQPSLEINTPAMPQRPRQRAKTPQPRRKNDQPRHAGLLI